MSGKMKIKIKKGDMVKVIAGDSKGSEGRVLEINAEDYTAIVEGVNLISKHSKPNAKNTQGGIVKREAPIQISNLVLLQGGKPVKVGRKVNADGKIVRIAKKTGEEIK